jgi:enamine deaminase RidA (YjgF/YER057c/UK114 family)
MLLIPHDPDEGVYTTGGDWIHGLEVRGAVRMLFVSGTMGLRPDFTAPRSLDEQLECVWNNLRTILASASMSVDNIVRLTTYLRDADFAEANARARIRALGNRRIPTTAIVAQTLQPDWLVELEIIAAA